MEIKSLTLEESNTEASKSQKEFEYEIIAQNCSLPWLTSKDLIEDIKELISNHQELNGLAVNKIHVYMPNFHIQSTDLSKQVLDLTLLGKVEVYHEVYETEDG
ncbi:hypothetical protein NIES2101_19940 [Calothrix sp. HK-06]|nr:hypothetical protein NIES2101_19940 [Calothrix sp. HK-06]